MKKQCKICNESKLVEEFSQNIYTPTKHGQLSLFPKVYYKSYCKKCEYKRKANPTGKKRGRQAQLLTDEQKKLKRKEYRRKYQEKHNKLPKRTHTRSCFKLNLTDEEKKQRTKEYNKLYNAKNRKPKKYEHLTFEEIKKIKNQKIKSNRNKNKVSYYEYQHKMANSLGAGVYMISNLIINKHYIGSSRTLYRRKVTHFSVLNSTSPSCPDLQNDMNLYGRENFTFEILENININNLEINEVKRILELNEQHWMDKLRLTHNLYNKDNVIKKRKNKKQII